MTGTAWRVDTARSVMPMFLVVLVYAPPGIYVRVVFTPRNDTAFFLLFIFIFYPPADG